MAKESSNMFQSVQSPEQRELERRQKILDIMSMQALSPMQAPPPGQSGPFQVAARTNPLEGLAKMLSAHVANKQGTELDQEKAALQSREMSEFATGLQAMQSATGEDAKAKLYEALNSSNPYLRQRAYEQLTQAPDLKAFNPGDVILDQNQGGRVFEPAGAVSGNPAYETVEINGDLYQKTATGLKKLDNAPRISNTTNVNVPGETMFDKKLGLEEATRLSKGIESRDTAIEAVEAISASKDLIKQGIYTGSYAKLGMGAEKLMAPFTDKNPEKAARTEQVISYIGNIVIPRMKDLGGSDTVEELKYMKQITAGEITLEEETMQRVLDSVEKKMRRRAETTDRAIKAYQSRGNSLPTLDEGVLPSVPGNADGIQVIWE